MTWMVESDVAALRASHPAVAAVDLARLGARTIDEALDYLRDAPRRTAVHALGETARAS